MNLRIISLGHLHINKLLSPSCAVAKKTFTQWRLDTVKLPKHFYFYLLCLSKTRGSQTIQSSMTFRTTGHVITYCMHIMRWTSPSPAPVSKKTLRWIWIRPPFLKTQQHTTALNRAVSFVHIDRNKKNQISSRTGKEVYRPSLYFNPSFSY